MTGDTRRKLRDLAQHRRDEQAGEVSGLQRRADQLARMEAELAEQVETLQLTLSTHITDIFERTITENYVAALQDRLNDCRTELATLQKTLIDARKDLEKKVIHHRQMERLVVKAQERKDQERDRQDELMSDDLASRSWFNVKEGDKR